MASTSDSCPNPEGSRRWPVRRYGGLPSRSTGGYIANLCNQDSIFSCDDDHSVHQATRNDELRYGRAGVSLCGGKLACWRRAFEDDATDRCGWNIAVISIILTTMVIL